MEPEIVERTAFTVLGIQRTINPMEADYPGIWEKEFGPRESKVKESAVEDGYYGIYFPAAEPGKADFIAGMAAGEVGDVPEGLVLRDVPGGLAAVFTCDMQEIGKTWRAIYSTWLPASGYAEDEARACYEYYPPGVHDGSARVTIVIPLIPA